MLTNNRHNADTQPITDRQIMTLSVVEWNVNHYFPPLTEKKLYSLWHLLHLPSVLWHCWLGVRKSIRPVKNWGMRCWHGYVSGARCKWFANGPADATATPSSLASLKSWMVLPFWYRLTQAVLDNNNNNLTTMFMVLSSWPWSLQEFTRFTWWM